MSRYLHFHYSGSLGKLLFCFSREIVSTKIFSQNCIPHDSIIYINLLITCIWWIFEWLLTIDRHLSPTTLSHCLCDNNWWQGMQFVSLPLPLAFTLSSVIRLMAEPVAIPVESLSGTDKLLNSITGLSWLVDGIPDISFDNKSIHQSPRTALLFATSVRIEAFIYGKALLWFRKLIFADFVYDSQQEINRWLFP